MKPITTHALSLLGVLAIVSSSSVAFAGSPLQQFTQGGPEANTANNQATGSIFWNPATITGLSDNRVHADVALSWRFASFQKTNGNQELDKSNLFTLDYQPNLAFTRQLSDTGLSIGVGVGRNYLDRTHWLDEAGEQRWQSIYSGMRTWTITPTLAYKFSDKFSLGINSQVTRVHAYGYHALDYGPIIEQQQGLSNVPREAPGNEGRAHYMFKGNAGAIGAGVTFSPKEGTDLGFSFTSASEVNINGDLSTYAPRNESFAESFGDMEDADATLNMMLPRRFQLAAQHQIKPTTTLFAGVDFVQWSMLDEITITTSGAVGGINEPGSVTTTEFKDVISARAGLQQHMGDRKSWIAQLGYESSPVSQDHASPAWIYGHSLSGSFGMTFPIDDLHKLGFSYTQRVMLPYQADESAYTPSTTGDYAKYDGFLSISLDLGFLNRTQNLPEVQEAIMGAEKL